MDPITLLATASAIWSGLKKASEFAAEAEGIWGQLSKYCGVADQLEQVIQEEKANPKKPKLFAKLNLLATRSKRRSMLSRLNTSSCRSKKN
jgi:hypothetical protein